MSFIKACSRYLVAGSAVFAISAGVVALPAAAQGASLAAQVKELTKKVQELQDVEQIRQVVIDYGRFFDTRDLASYAGLFAKDGVWSGDFGGGYTNAAGPSGVLAMMQKALGPNPVYDPRDVKGFHLMTNIVIHVNGDHATGLTKWTFFSRSKDGDKPVPNSAGHYDDTFVRENGTWKFLHRVVTRDAPPQKNWPAN